jgi:hypothetical protein
MIFIYYSMQVYIIKLYDFHEIYDSNNHMSDPEENDIVACLQDTGWVIAT